MSDAVYRVMMRCSRPGCQRWWSVHPSERLTAMCACTGELYAVDMAAHLATVPYVPMKPPNGG